ncbi:MAG TPA: hypothetical protein VE959_27960 [Bryobacteraceae bacterium]|nr:hypothetical protein [Bryobacteraceae bacterium]
MIETSFHNRRAARIENDSVRVTATFVGGHIAEILDKASGVSPLWIPPWPSIEPTSYSRERHPEYGADSESPLLSGIMGHNLCLDLFGGPSEEEAAAGIIVHGEANLVPYDIAATGAGMTARCAMPIAQIAFERGIRLAGRRVQFRETVENLSPLDRPIAWTQHVTLGPPFLERGTTQFRVPAVKSRGVADGSDFDWPWLPKPDGGKEDLRVYTSAQSSGGFTTHLLGAENGKAYFLAYSPASKVLFGYVWSRDDFPWLGIWEENHSRTHAPWNGRALTRGMEFGVSPFPESRRQMIQRRDLFGTPGYRWLPAKTRLTAEYYAAITQADAIPETLAEFEALAPA